LVQHQRTRSGPKPDSAVISRGRVFHPSSAQYRTYVLDLAAFFSQYQTVRSPRVHSFLRHDATIFVPDRRLNLSAHRALATFTKLRSGSWRVQLRRKGKYVNDTFLRRKDAEEWALRRDRARRPDGSRRASARGRCKRVFAASAIRLRWGICGRSGLSWRGLSWRRPADEARGLLLSYALGFRPPGTICWRLPGALRKIALGDALPRLHWANAQDWFSNLSDALKVIVSRRS
jgi:hypothetical protein